MNTAIATLDAKYYHLRMTRISLQEAAKDLAGLIHRARDGEAILLVEGNEIVARLESVERRSTGRRVAGSMKDTLIVPARLMEPLTDAELEEIWGKDNI